MRAIQAVLAAAVVTLAACGKKPDAAQAPAADSAGSMGNMGMAMPGMQMMPLMRAHLDSVAAMQPSQMAAEMPAHQVLASRMMDAMGGDMRGRSMQPDSAWTALADSVRRDLAALPGLTGEGLRIRMQAHAAQMQRLMLTHEGMMHM